MTDRWSPTEGDGLADENGEPDGLRIRLAENTIPASVFLVLVLTAGLAASGLTRDPEGAVVQVPAQGLHRPPTPPPLLLKPTSREAALDFNRRIPFARGISAAASPFQLGSDDEAQARALECLTAAIYYEAAHEGRDGQRAVAQVVLNRVRHPAFPASICEVVFQGSTRDTGCQFTFTCDGSLMRAPARSLWSQARSVAWEALSGAVYAPVGLATHYHASYVVPYWATSLAKGAEVGLHIFYRWSGDWGHPVAFHQRYSKRELDPHQLRASALMAEGVWPFAPGSGGEHIIEATADPNVELAGVVALLARAPEKNETTYEKAARSYFLAHSNHLAVGIMRGVRDGAVAPAGVGQAAVIKASAPIGQSAAPTPAAWREGAVFSSAARDFARQSDFARFFRDQRSAYEDAGAQLGRASAEATALWETYTRVPVRSRKVVISLSSMDDSSKCLLKHIGAPNRWLIRWSAQSSKSAPADIFVAAGLAQGILDWREVKNPKALDSALEEQVVRAVFARIEALRNGERASARTVSAAAKAGHAFVPQLVERLKQYEKNRGEYRSLNEFLPTLVAGAHPASHTSRKSGIRQVTC